MEYNTDVWENGDYPGLYRKIGWTPNRMGVINEVLSRSPGTMLDIGCLDGCYIEKLRSLGFTGNYMGVDITKAHIAAATKRLPEEKFQIEDARDLSFEDDAFELVILSDVIQHLPSAGEAIAEITRVASKHVLLSCYGSYKKTYQKPDNGRCFNVYYTEADIRKMFPAEWDIEFKTFRHPTLSGLTKKYTIFHFYATHH